MYADQTLLLTSWTETSTQQNIARGYKLALLKYGVLYLKSNIYFLNETWLMSYLNKNCKIKNSIVCLQIKKKSLSGTEIEVNYYPSYICYSIMLLK